MRVGLASPRQGHSTGMYDLTIYDVLCMWDYLWRTGAYREPQDTIFGAVALISKGDYCNSQSFFVPLSRNYLRQKRPKR